MGTVSNSPYFRSKMTEPLSTVLIDNPLDAEKIPVIADEASIVPGMITFISASTYANEISMADAVHGKTALQGQILVVEIESSDIHHPANFDKTTAGADLQPMQAYVIKKDMKFWAKGSTLTAAEDEELVCGANGVITNVGDPDGVAIDEVSHTFVALAAITSGTWIPVRYVGKFAHDKSA